VSLSVRVVDTLPHPQQLKDLLARVPSPWHA
jgi:hypothetical protein